jgi:SH3-like domain-containing protein
MGSPFMIARTEYRIRMQAKNWMALNWMLVIHALVAFAGTWAAAPAALYAQAIESLGSETEPTTEESAEADADPEKDALRLPRFAALRTNEVNARVGPGKQYAIRWVYRRATMPVEIIEQYEYWRKIRDVDGDTGWVHKSMLTSKRTAIIRDETRLLMREPELASGIILRAQAGVIAALVGCEAQWCRLQIESRKGWLPKNQIFGAYPDESFH